RSFCPPTRWPAQTPPATFSAAPAEQAASRRRKMSTRTRRAREQAEREGRRGRWPVTEGERRLLLGHELPRAPGRGQGGAMRPRPARPAVCGLPPPPPSFRRRALITPSTTLLPPLHS